MTWFKPEAFALVLNFACMLFYTYQWQEPGKILYWLGATIITVGLLLMKG